MFRTRRIVGFAAAMLVACISTAHAGGDHDALIPHEDFTKVDKTRLSYHIDSETCEVTLKTRRNIRRITQRDPDGNILKRWSTKEGERVRIFSDFDKYPGLLTEGTIKVKTGYKDKVKFHEIGDDFRADLTDCLTQENIPTCELPEYQAWLADASLAVTSGVDEGIIGSAPTILNNREGSCTLAFEFTDPNRFIEYCDAARPAFFLNDLGTALGRTGYSPGTPAPSDGCGITLELIPSGGFDPLEVEACAIALGCDNY